MCVCVCVRVCVWVCVCVCVSEKYSQICTLSHLLSPPLLLFLSPLPTFTLPQEYKKAKADKKFREEQEARRKALDEYERDKKESFKRVQSSISQRRSMSKKHREDLARQQEREAHRQVCVCVCVCVCVSVCEHV